MDGDARGGAALSIRSITGQPLKFVGMGEKFDALEPFHPDRVAQRILGIGDMLSLIEKVEETMDQKKAEEMQRKLIENEFTLEISAISSARSASWAARVAARHDAQYGHDQESQRRQGGRERNHAGGGHHRFDDAQERANHMFINGARRRRIAKGSGTTVQEVNALLNQYAQARKMMKSITGGGFLGKRLGKFKLPMVQ